MALRNLKGIRELRFLLCQSSPASEGLRVYIANNYEAIRASQAAITVRQAQMITPTAIATYNYGIERKVNLKKRTPEEIEAIIAQLEAESEKISSQIRI